MLVYINLSVGLDSLFCLAKIIEVEQKIGVLLSLQKLRNKVLVISSATFFGGIIKWICHGEV